ncbi:MAG TPA: hypothetical protein PK636_08010, partial [bacterium]|nr:hypothetical protein [bacterium]
PTPTPSVPPTPLPVPTGNWTAWTQINEDGFGNVNNFSAFALACYEGSIYAGSWNNSDGCEVWRWEGDEPTDWAVMTDGGFGTSETAAPTA